MSEHKIGDTVQLKSGGLIMTVESDTFGGFCTCSWFKDDEKLENRFHEDQLIPAKEKHKPLY